jgi:hypothetical protein
VFEKRESSLWKLVRENLKKDFLLTRIESVATAGVPDVYVVNKKTGVDAWVELKIIRGKKPSFGSEQVAWILRHANVGKNIYILARKDNTIYLWSGKKVLEVASKGLEIEAKKWSRPFNWVEISGCFSQQKDNQ